EHCKRYEKDRPLSPRRSYPWRRRIQPHQHSHTNKQHHNAADEQNDLRNEKKLRTQLQEDSGRRQKRDNQKRCAVHCIAPRDHQHRTDHGNAAEEIKDHTIQHRNPRAWSRRSLSPPTLRTPYAFRSSESGIFRQKSWRWLLAAWLRSPALRSMPTRTAPPGQHPRREHSQVPVESEY